jgi:predicted acetylornithine/succinylornithine family transaminase
MKSLAEREHRAFIPTYARLPLEVTGASGMYLRDTSGRSYLDFLGGLAVLALGHGHPAVLAAVEVQMRRYAHVSNVFLQDVQIEFAEALNRMSGFDGVFLANSGTEAVEAAIKLVRRLAHEQNRSSIISFTGSFHGRSTSALGLMTEEKYRWGYGPWPSTHTHLPFNDVSALREHVDGGTAAVFIEPVQGEGGVHPVSPEFVTACNDLRKEHGFLVISDEIQCGAGRTGSFLAAEHYGLHADAVVMAKAIGGGLPLGALLVHSDLRTVFGIGGHGSTFGGNPVACAAGLAVLREIERGDLMSNARIRGAQLLAGIAAIADRLPGVIVDIRGAGLMLGIELASGAQGVQKRCLDAGLLVNVTREHVIRLLPPLIVGEAECNDALSILAAAMEAEDLEQRNAGDGGEHTA